MVLELGKPVEAGQVRLGRPAQLDQPDQSGRAGQARGALDFVRSGLPSDVPSQQNHKSSMFFCFLHFRGH